ncbi:hypothetical protein BGZ61DRAFT_436949, partial [Ilyonectria robusta]|uniref:uncharacterized protein n=1 Tax=Ilyonectria robusta TaxID=1079257 RepID=UPI001E8D8C33
MLQPPREPETDIAHHISPPTSTHRHYALVTQLLAVCCGACEVRLVSRLAENACMLPRISYLSLLPRRPTPKRCSSVRLLPPLDAALCSRALYCFSSAYPCQRVSFLLLFAPWYFSLVVIYPLYHNTYRWISPVVLITLRQVLVYTIVASAALFWTPAPLPILSILCLDHVSI